MMLPALTLTGSAAVDRLMAGKLAIVFAAVGPFRVVGFVHPDGTVEGSTMHLGPVLWPIRPDGSLGYPSIVPPLALPPAA